MVPEGIDGNRWSCEIAKSSFNEGKALLMKAKGLENEGISSWIYTGSYQYPSLTITENILNDIMLIDKVIGVKIALSDHRSSHPTIEE